MLPQEIQATTKLVNKPFFTVIYDINSFQLGAVLY